MTLQPPTPIAPSLALADWLADPYVSFARELINPLWAPSTHRVYCAMWGKFTTWLNTHHLRLHDCSATDIQTFLDTSLPNNIRTPGKTKTERDLILKEHKERKEQRNRYVRLIERVYTHLLDKGLYVQNPGSDAGKSRVGAGKNESTKFLSSRECELLFGDIRTFLDLSIPEILDPTVIEDARQWAGARDLCLAGVMVGCGVRVEEVGRLTVNCTIQYDSGDEGLPHIVIPGAPGVKSREALCFPIAEMALAAWMKWRNLLPTIQDVPTLFPADLRLRRHDQLKDDPAMHPSSVFRRISKVLTAAGITGNRVGGQTLRNTYASMLVEAECTDLEIMEAMGLQTSRSVLRLRDNLKAFEGA